MRTVLGLTVVVASLFNSSAARSQSPADPTAGSAIEVRQQPSIASMNGFVENRGQWPEEVLFLARKNGIEAVLLRDALVLHPMPRWTGSSQTDEQRQAGMPPQPEIVPGPPLVIRLPRSRAIEAEVIGPTAHHFLLGSGTTSNVPGFERVAYRDVVPGIDVVVRAGAEWFAYDLHVRPGADLGALTLEIDGVQSAELVDDSVLVMQTSAGRVEQRIEAAWQLDPTSRQEVAVASRFRLLDMTDDSLRVGFEAPGRDPSAMFVLDPSLVYATYVGGSGQEVLRDMDVAPDGSVYLAARTSSGPTTLDAFQPLVSGGLDAWAGKLSPDGSILEWGTFLGGTATEEVKSIDVDKDGTVVVFGNTWSSEFPVTPGSLDTTIENAPFKAELFISKLAPDGSRLVWSTFYGGPDHELAYTSALFPSGDVLVVAEAFINNPPATPGAFDTVFNADDRMLTRISADGSQLVFQTYFHAGVNDIEFDSDSNIFLGGGADDALPATPGAFKETLEPGDTSDAFVAKMSADGSQLHWATYLGGDGSELVFGLEVDESGAVYVAGHTLAADFPVTVRARGTTANSTNGFVTKLLPAGSGLVWSTYLSTCCGAQKSTLLSGLAVDPAGNAFVAGSSNGPDFPVTPDAFQSSFVGGLSEAHLSKMDAFGESLVYSTYFGGNSSDSLSRVGLDGVHDAYLVIQTTSTDIPVTPGAYDPSYSGSGDVVVAKFTGIAVAPWRVRGGGVPGSLDTPNLAGAGALTPRSPTRLSVRGGVPSASAMLVVSLPGLDGPAVGGNTLAPTTAVMLPTGTNAQGALDLTFAWPGFPAGLRLFVQVWIADPTGWSATNELQLTSQ